LTNKNSSLEIRFLPYPAGGMTDTPLFSDLFSIRDKKEIFLT